MTAGWPRLSQADIDELDAIAEATITGPPAHLRSRTE